MDEPAWKKLKLSLERPYKDDNGEPIPSLQDTLPDGQLIYEPPVDLAAGLGERLHRIFSERGHDFFETMHRPNVAQPPVQDPDDQEEKSPIESAQPMTPEELFKMRMEILPQLHISLGEMCQARDLLSLLLSTDSDSSQSSQLSLVNQLSQPREPQSSQPTDLPPSSLTTTLVTKPPPIQSVQVFNTQLVIGGKDEALRNAADLFKSAAEEMERGRQRNEQYWVTALKIRRGNWSLLPAPLPLGSSTGKGADKASKDFLVSFNLEESPPLFRRRAIGRVPTTGLSQSLEFPLRQQTRLQVSIIFVDLKGKSHRATNSFRKSVDDSLNDSLTLAQAEVVEQEIFSILIKEASNLPTASTRVSERLIVIEAAQEIELQFELADSEALASTEVNHEAEGTLCDLIFDSLHLLLLRAHSHAKSKRLTYDSHRPSLVPLLADSEPRLLQPIIDGLQYRAFCGRVTTEINHLVQGLQRAGVKVKMHRNLVGESGEQFLSFIRHDSTVRLGGECTLRIDERYTLRFTFNSPSSLIAHLPQATLPIASIHQLTQLLTDETGRCLLGRICEIGQDLCEHVHGTWFVDLLTSRCIGRWEGRVLNFRILFKENGALICTASRLERGDQRPNSKVDTYGLGHPDITLFEWVQRQVESALRS